MMPDVTVCPMPSGLPTASTTSPDAHLIGVPERQYVVLAAPDLKNRKIARRIASDELGLLDLALSELDFDVLRRRR